MIKYEIQINIQYDSWNEDEYCYSVVLFNNILDNGVQLTSIERGSHGPGVAIAYAYAIYNIMDHAETIVKNNVRG